MDGNCSTRFGLIECRKQASTRVGDGRPAIVRRNLSTDGQAYRRVAAREPAQLPQSRKRPSPPWSRGASTWSHGSAGSWTSPMDYPILYFSTGTCRPGAGRAPCRGKGHSQVADQPLCGGNIPRWRAGFALRYGNLPACPDITTSSGVSGQARKTDFALHTPNPGSWKRPPSRR